VISDIVRGEQPISLGSLSGNHFEITLRDVRADEAATAAACEALRTKGFVNFFGLQRFGSQGVPTSAVGCAILRHDWKAAVSLILAARGSDDESAAAAKRAYFERGDARRAVGMIPPHMRVEKAVLEVLARQGPNAQYEALQAVDKKLRLMYVHAYQSLLWNSAASHRVAHSDPDHAIEGDIVIRPGEPTEAATAKPIVVTAADAKSRRWTIWDVVLPLPGRSVILPNHSTKLAYTTTLAADGLSVESLGSTRYPEYSLCGGYRRVVLRPTNFTYARRPYDTATDPLILTDADRLADDGAREFRPLSEPLEGSAAPTDHRAPPMSALCLSFSLPSSAYATTMLHELTKHSMSPAFHTERSQESAARRAGETGGGGGGDRGRY